MQQLLTFYILNHAVTIVHIKYKHNKIVPVLHFAKCHEDIAGGRRGGNSFMP
jgi:hypothetical protein